MKWFKHDADANMDAKLQEVLLDYGLEGYGLYWYCIEMITSKVSKDNLTFELEHDARIIARNTGSTVQRVEEMMRRFVALGLFSEDNGTIKCLKLLKRLDTSMTNSPQMREMIAKARSRHDDVMTLPDDVMLEENRTEEKKNSNNGDSTESPKPVKPAKSKNAVQFKNWLTGIREAGEKAIPDDDPIIAYADDAGLPQEYLSLAWHEFKARYTDNQKRYKDWRSVFRRSVREKWFNFWWVNNGQYELTSLGQQAMAAMKASMGESQ